MRKTSRRGSAARLTGFPSLPRTVYQSAAVPPEGILLIIGFYPVHWQQFQLIRQIIGRVCHCPRPIVARALWACVTPGGYLASLM